MTDLKNMDKIELRKVMENDWNFILNLRNEFYTNSFYEQKKLIQKTEHYEYMSKQTTNPNFHQWIAIQSKNPSPIGYIRILDQDVNIMVEKKFQTKGIGTVMLNLVEKEARRLGIKKLKAKVLIGNDSSKKIFEKNNYKLKMYSFEKEIL